MSASGWFADRLLFGPQTVKTEIQIIVLEERRQATDAIGRLAWCADVDAAGDFRGVRKGDRTAQLRMVQRGSRRTGARSWRGSGGAYLTSSLMSVLSAKMTASRLPECSHSI
jgi:hypothetical protein